ncbi:hypothetical protein ACXIUJ_23805 [Vibrio parahaemolyticus]|nr:hypothetical protein [Vibrio parahaemolyticus]HCE1489499.1 hypothetical protein [Vibrio parahaemolyticus]HCM0447497.1 hypothetical protein [Vibrio parahaemolyticus]
MEKDRAVLLWKNIQDEIFSAQKKVDYKFKSCTDFKQFYNFLKFNADSLNVIDIELFDIKFLQYGKIIKTTLIIPENGRLYCESAYYPLSKKYFGKLRIAISNKFSISNHYMERLIERKNITKTGEVKNFIKEYFKKMDESNFRYEVGGLDISTEFIIVSRDSVSFCDLEIDSTQHCETVMKTIITENEFTIINKKMVTYILDKTNSEVCFLATHTIPKTTIEADNVIEDTKKRTSGTPYSWEEIEMYKNIPSSSFKSDKKLIKAFVDYLGKYDPNSSKYQKHLINT